MKLYCMEELFLEHLLIWIQHMEQLWDGMDVGIKQLSIKNAVWWWCPCSSPGTTNTWLVSPRHDIAISTAKTHSVIECILLVTILYCRSSNRHLRVSSWCCRLVRCLRSFIKVCKVYSSSVGELRHHTWVGKAQWSALTSPSRLVVSTERNMLASINTDTGAIGTRLFFYYMHALFYSILMRPRI